MELAKLNQKRPRDGMINHLCRAAVLSSVPSDWRVYNHLTTTLSVRLWCLSMVPCVGISALVSEPSLEDDAN